MLKYYFKEKLEEGILYAKSRILPPQSAAQNIKRYFRLAEAPNMWKRKASHAWPENAAIRK